MWGHSASPHADCLGFWVQPIATSSGDSSCYGSHFLCSYPWSANPSHALSIVLVKGPVQGSLNHEGSVMSLGAQSPRYLQTTDPA